MNLKPGDAIPQKIKDWHSADKKHAADWRKEAREDYDFVAGKQFTDAEEADLKLQLRPVVVFNDTQVLVDAVLGAEMGNRKEVRYIPREEGDTKKDELLTSAAEWFRDRTAADMEESEAFRDGVICGMGWTETRMVYDENPDGDPEISQRDPFEMLWDYRTRKRNLADAERIWHIKKTPLATARAMVPEINGLPTTYDDLHANWADFADQDGDSPHIKKAVPDRMAGKSENEELTEVTLVEVQWIERETFYRYESPDDGSVQSLPEAEYEEANRILSAKGGQGLNGVKQSKKVRYQAVLGNRVLSYGPTPCPDEFNYQCITGKLDRNKGTYYGIVRAMKDPQRWKNKFFSQMMHIINSGAKGGILAERTAFENTEEAERTYARPDAITWMQSGALSNPNGPKFAPKPVTTVPPAIQYMIDFTTNAIRGVSGVNQELLGNREADQPGVLEYQRKQAALTVLQWIFDSLKGYRQRQGELMLYYLQNDLSDGRLVKIVGDEGAQYVKLVKPESTDKEYDVIVDDMPTSPNNKEAVWSMVMNMPKVFQGMMTPEVAMAMMEYSPFPTGVQEKIKKAGQQASQSPQAQMAQRMQQVEIELTEMKAFLAKAQGMKAMAEAETAGNDAEANDPQLEMAVEREKNMGKLQIEQTKVQGQLQIQQAKAQGDLQIKGMEAQANMQLAQSQAAQQASLSERQFQSEDRRAERQQSIDTGLRRQEIQSGAQTKVKTATIAAKAKPKPKGKT